MLLFVSNVGSLDNMLLNKKKYSLFVLLIFCLCLFVILVPLKICCKIKKDSFCILPMFCLYLFVMLVHLNIFCKINKDSFCVPIFLLCLFVILVHLTICYKINKGSFCILLQFCLYLFAFVFFLCLAYVCIWAILLWFLILCTTRWNSPCGWYKRRIRRNSCICVVGEVLSKIEVR